MKKDIEAPKGSDKLDLINFAIYNIEKMRESGMDNNKIAKTLSEQFDFSNSLIEQLL